MDHRAIYAALQTAGYRYPWASVGRAMTPPKSGTAVSNVARRVSTSREVALALCVALGLLETGADPERVRAVLREVFPDVPSYWDGRRESQASREQALRERLREVAA